MFSTRPKDCLNPEALEIVKLIAEVLIRYIDAYAKPISYKHLTVLIENLFGVRIWYRNSLAFYLSLLMPICKVLGIPPLSATVVRKDSGIPGKGFAPWYKQHHPDCCNIDDEQLSRDLRDEAMRCQQWQLLLDYLDIDYRFKGNQLTNKIALRQFYCPYAEEDFSNVVF